MFRDLSTVEPRSDRFRVWKGGQPVDALKEAVIRGDGEATVRLVAEAVQSGYSPQQVLDSALIPAMDVVGKKYSEGEFFLPEMLVAAKAMQAAMDSLRPLLTAGEMPSAGRVVIGTVKGDLHDIGKNLVRMMLEQAGFTVVDLGRDVPPERFVDAVRQHDAQIIGMSALLTTTMPAMRTTIEALKIAGLRERIKVMVGGAPVTPRFATEIGADGYAPDALRAAEKARELVHTTVGQPG
jgi:5-methyltetrahydrofolate--homocysteine methyltransferase